MGWDFWNDIVDAVESVPDGLTDLGETIAGGFSSGYRFVASEAVSAAGTVEGGALVAFQGATGAVTYAIDYSRAGVGTAQAWAVATAGDVAGFTVRGYERATTWAVETFELLASLAQTTLPPLGPPSGVARDIMSYLLGAGVNDRLVSLWEGDARDKGYTLAFDFRGTVSVPQIATTAFSGIYVDKAGAWGFFAQAGSGTSVMTLSPNAQLAFEIYMVFGGRDRFGQSCFMPGLNVSLPLPDGTAVALGGNVLLTTGFDFLGFRLMAGMNLLAATDDDGRPTVGILPSSGPASPNLIAATHNAPAFDAAIQVQKGAAPGDVVANAALATLPFVRDPGGTFALQVEGTRLVLEVPPGGVGSDDVQLQQALWTGGENQRFTVVDAGGGAFRVRPLSAPGRALTLRGGSYDDRAALTQGPDDGSDASRFRFMLSDDGWCSMISARSGKGICVQDASSQPGAPIVQYAWAGTSNQKLRFVPQGQQAGWRWCQKCSGLYFAGAPSACPAGSVHDPTGSGRYLLGFHALTPGEITQDRWRWCHKCSGLYYGGLPTAGVCPSDRGAHAQQGSGNYALDFSEAPSLPKRQSGWRWCQKCQGLWFGAHPQRACPAGGSHVETGSAAYRVWFE